MKLKEEMTEVELRYYLTLLDEGVFKNGVNFTNHALKRMKKRKLTPGKIQYVVREGDIFAIRFDKETKDLLFIISYATRGQFKKGFTTYATYSLMTGKVLTAWNRGFEIEEERLANYKKTKIHFDRNTLGVVRKYIDSKFHLEGQDFVNFIRKYDKTPFSERTQEKIQSYLQGITPIYHL